MACREGKVVDLTDDLILHWSGMPDTSINLRTYFLMMSASGTTRMVAIGSHKRFSTSSLAP